jgi:hypothetical protein
MLKVETRLMYLNALHQLSGFINFDYFRNLFKLWFQ